MPVMTMASITTPRGVNYSYERTGSGPALVLVHGAFGDHEANWTFVKPRLSESFTLYAVARRGRGETTTTVGHSLIDEAEDLVALIERLDEPVFLLGHSYGAHCAMEAARRLPDRIRRLVLYEPAWPSLMTPALMARLETLAAERAWDDFAFTFFHEALFVPAADVEAQRPTELWPPILSDAPATLGDLRALASHDFIPARYAAVTCPVLLQVGTESPRSLYVTDALAGVLPDVRIGELAGQAHEGMTTGPEQYAAAVETFLFDRG